MRYERLGNRSQKTDDRTLESETSSLKPKREVTKK